MLLLKERLVALVKAIDAQFLSGLIFADVRDRQHNKYSLGNLLHFKFRRLCRPVFEPCDFRMKILKFSRNTRLLLLG